MSIGGRTCLYSEVARQLKNVVNPDADRFFYIAADFSVGKKISLTGKLDDLCQF